MYDVHLLLTTRLAFFWHVRVHPSRISLFSEETDGLNVTGESCEETDGLNMTMTIERRVQMMDHCMFQPLVRGNAHVVGNVPSDVICFMDLNEFDKFIKQVNE